MAKLEFDDELSRLVEEFNSSSGAILRRKRISQILSPQPNDKILDVGSGPGHQVFELSSLIGPSGSVIGLDSAESAIEISQTRCSGMSNVSFQVGSVFSLPFQDSFFDIVMSSQVFEYLDDVESALKEIFRVLKPGGLVLIHDTDWGALLWNSSDASRMRRFMDIWDGHLADPHLPQSLGFKLKSVGFKDVKADPLTHTETTFTKGSMSDVLIKFISGYLVSQGISQNDVDDWVNDLYEIGSSGGYFYSSNEYVFTARK
jgi:SAM-dependent methyltransferase